MDIAGLPWTSSALGLDGTVGFCGSKTRIGIGAVDCATPQTAIALTACCVLPSMPAKNVGILFVTVTRMKAVGATPTGGVVTPATELGKSTNTLSPTLPLVALV